MSRTEIFREINPSAIIIANFKDEDTAKEAFHNIAVSFHYDNASFKLSKSEIEISHITSDLYLQNMLSIIEEQMGANISLK